MSEHEAVCLNENGVVAGVAKVVVDDSPRYDPDSDLLVVLKERDALRKDLERATARLTEERAVFEANTVQFQTYVGKLAATIEELQLRVIDPVELARLRERAEAAQNRTRCLLNAIGELTAALENRPSPKRYSS